MSALASLLRVFRRREAQRVPPPRSADWNSFLAESAPDDTVRVRVRGMLIVRNRQALLAMVEGWLANGARYVVLDFGGCSYVDASGLGVLVSISKRARAVGGALRIENPNEDIRTALLLTKLDTLFEIGPSPSESARRARRGSAE